ncbi:MAG: transposase [Candidatus Omnitrophota bacterium]
MSYRETPLANGEMYHIFTKSIAGFKIFNSPNDFRRMLNTLIFYASETTPCKLSLFLRKQANTNSKPALEFGSRKIVEIVAYCIMPTHIHLIIKQLEDNGISRYINLILKSYSKYFNEKHNRKGPLWECRFKNVLVETEEQFLHLTRYIHLNPSTAYLVDEPANWEFSSYKEYLGVVEESKRVCSFLNYLYMSASSYENFVKDFVDYERTLSKIKHLVLD